MIVFHGSNMEVAIPFVHLGRNNLDFGKGFYVTTLQKQAERWAETIVRLRPKGTAIINKYELDYEGIKNAGFAILSFAEYNEEWLDFIVANRNGELRWKQYDLIEGGIANDRVFDTIENYMSGGIDKQTALGRLRYEHPNNQICILNQKIIEQHLIYLGCEIIKP